MSVRPGWKVLRQLLEGETVDLEGSGILVRAIPGDLSPGDDYVGARNTINLLTVKKVDHENGWVVPVEAAYLFDTHECVKVEVVSS